METDLKSIRTIVLNDPIFENELLAQDDGHLFKNFPKNGDNINPNWLNDLTEETAMKICKYLE